MLGRAIVRLHRMWGGEPADEELEELCRAALPLEEERGDPRRLALLWGMLGTAANFRMQTDDELHAAQQAFRYRRQAGDSPIETWIEWPLILGPRPADEAMRTIDGLAALLPPGSTDLPRAALLAMGGRFDEAWPLAEARSAHFREISGNTLQNGHLYLWLIALIEGDRERAIRHNADMIEVLADALSVSAAFWAFQARELCYLGRLDEAESWLRKLQDVPPRATVRAMAPAAEALLLAERGDLEQAAELAWTAVTRAETETDNIWLQGFTNEDLASILERAGRTDEARERLERALAIWERKGCLPCAARARAQIDTLAP